MTFNFKIVSVNDTESSGLDHLHQQDETCAAVTFSFLMNTNSFPVSLTLTQSYSMFTTNLLTVQSFSSQSVTVSLCCVCKLFILLQFYSFMFFVSLLSTLMFLSVIGQMLPATPPSCKCVCSYTDISDQLNVTSHQEV